ncbi:septal ring lytic transglycosylase RlpA family protein [Colwellia sp. 12G3]|uniref:septal ring lytic transglycosylase RlpA family protein n=1 Tax=Colwellia sp. 12G3 TaxID=2058299 RepID=UPI000C339F6B|nr:septal ring lytic transglycosylase RlpA family protein [Colwellia sp. 12G3]PKI16833.1 septal ring lytic transglycosylase RlpA [Colwellia sp. 12G3]
MTQRFLLFCYVLFLSLLSACSSDRYQQKHDSTPTRIPSQAELKDAIARAEPYSRGGNKNYQVWGKSYQVLTSAQGFEQTGTASWYGKKFHGHLTSNGEIYDMYSMSAAHKNLPLPTYLKVTNTANNKSVIVRVNDRGPFHQSRVIDLSYSAAYKLDMLKTGTAHVKITAITDFDKNTGQVITAVEKPVSPLISSTATTPAKIESKKQLSTQKTTTMGIATPYIQVFATSKKDLAISTANKLKNQYKQQTSYPENQGLFRIQIGPISDLATLNALLLALKENGYPNAYPRTAPQ